MRLGRVSSGGSRCWADRVVRKGGCVEGYACHQIDELRSNEKVPHSTMTCTSDLRVELGFAQPSRTSLFTNPNTIIYIHNRLLPSNLP